MYILWVKDRTWFWFQLCFDTYHMVYSLDEINDWCCSLTIFYLKIKKEEAIDGLCLFIYFFSFF